MKSSVCLVLSGPTLADCRRQFAENRNWIDLAEIRADLLDRSEWVGLNAFSREVELPLILTLRMPRDGGRWEGPPEERQSFFQEALTGNWKYLDIEADFPLPEIEKAWLAMGRLLIKSFHDLTKVPANLSEKVKSLAGPGVIPKAAVTAENSASFLSFVKQVLNLPPGDRLVLAMGGFGFASRVLSARLGSLWTYASPEGQVVAPGQVSPRTLHQLYRHPSITAETPVYGVVGNPVFHSKSPYLHNRGFALTKFDGVYLPFLADDLKSFFSACSLLGVKGVSVTIPFKEEVLPHLKALSPSVRATGACNTVFRQNDGSWGGDNTDAPGFLEPLKELWEDDFDGKRVTVIGSGGAARGIVWMLRKRGIQVLVLGRNLAKTKTLAQDMGAQGALLGPESLTLVQAHSDLIVQTTNVGMGDQEGQNPLDWYHFSGGEVAYDIIYVPRETAFLKAAAAADCPVIYGREMLYHQAVLQFQKFTGREYPPGEVDL